MNVTFPAPPDPAWAVSLEGFDAGRVASEETMFTLANGHHGLRGTPEVARHHGDPGAYYAGVFDTAPRCFEELAKAPNWCDLDVGCEGVPLDPATAKLHGYRRTLDLRRGLLGADITWTDAKGHRTRFESWRLVHRAKAHRALIWGRVTPVDWSGELVLAGGIDADQDSGGQDPALRLRHVDVTRLAVDPLGAVCEGATHRTRLPLALRTRLEVDRRAQRSLRLGRRSVQEVLTLRATRGRPVAFVKAVAHVACRSGDGRPGPVARRELKALLQAGQPKTLAAHERAWASWWRDGDVEIGGNLADQAAVRFNLFQLMSLATDEDLDVSYGAKGLHGEGYRGHAFWDTELFMLPYFQATRPRVARNLLMYRSRRLPGARRHAARWGDRGARFPWESGTTGDDVTPCYPADVIAGKVREEPDPHWQVHISADVAYAVDRYRAATGDEAFHREHGARILIGTAQYWAGRVTRRGKRYVIRDVQCVDEHHNHVDNDAYTNHFAHENLRLGIEAVDELAKRAPARLKRILAEAGLTRKEVRRWREIRDGLYLPYDRKTGLVEQFDGYFDLPPVKVSHDENGWPFLPRVFWATNTAQGSQAIKQADVVLLQYLLPEAFSAGDKLANYRYYAERDLMGSSLSPSTSAIMGVEVGETAMAYRAFRVGAYRDLLCRKSADGIHAACLGGTWQACVNGFAGLRVKGGTMHFAPWLPTEWDRLAFRLCWRGSRIAVELTRKAFRARLLSGKPVDIAVRGEKLRITRSTTRLPLT